MCQVYIKYYLLYWCCYLVVHSLEFVMAQKEIFITDRHRACLRKLTIGFKMAGRR